jgi:hypothetical protein
MKSNDLNRKLSERPFQPFRLKTVNNTVYDVRNPNLVIVANSSAVLATREARDAKGRVTRIDWRTISIQHIVEFADLDVKEVR